ncbi:MAG: CRTAC1 family protein [Anaerolineae bacterium]|nr:CRTAC1 family protein [Anaerolineae bacterium]
MSLLKTGFVGFLTLLLTVIVSAQETMTVEIIPLAESEACSGSFVTHELDHITTIPSGDTVQMFEANGSGVAVNDLNNDGLLDIVLGNHAGQNTILWNEGNLNFRTSQLPIGDTRAVTLIDYNLDGWIDIFITRTASAPNLWLNQGDETFQQAIINSLSEPLYAITWGDIDADGDLDLVGATYDAALLNDFGQEFLLDGRGGVYVYENDNGLQTGQQLINEAQALALVLVDINRDGRLDILVGNDFAVPDYAWYNLPTGWQPAAFKTTTHSTMSFDFADVNNDGSREIFATDMMPYSDDPQTMFAWQPIMESMMDEDHAADDPQIMENVLQIADSVGYYNDALNRGINATGWSWSGKFGDLNQDGFLDLYVVNGMIERTIFAHLPNHELVEENQVLANNGLGEFVAMPQWLLNSEASGRGMALADFDMDGDLDIVVNNLRGAAQLFENQLCEGRSLQVELNKPNSNNPQAIGATLALESSIGTLYRDVRSTSGYLSGDSARVHFGFPANTELYSLTITWSDGSVSTVDDLRPQNLYRITLEN